MTRRRVTIRRAEAADAAELAELGGRTFRATYAATMPAGLLDQYVSTHFGPARQRDELADPACEVLVAEEGPTMIGYALLHAAAAPIPAAAGASVQLERLYVDEQAQGHGVGTALLARAVVVARSGGHHLMWLTVWEHNSRALAVYRRWGFTDVGEVAFDLAGEPHRDRALVLEAS